MQITAGYKTITSIQFTNAVWALNEGLIGGHGLRVYLACFELTAIREAAARSSRKEGRKSKDLARYRLVELERLTALSGEDMRRALRRLQAVGLVTFTEGQVTLATSPLPGSEELLGELACRRSSKRPIPVPRRLLRFLARNRSIAHTKTIVAYLLRGLSIARRTGEINAKGTIKTSWIEEHFQLSERAVRYAQDWLREHGWISKDTASKQTKLNRHGAYFVINLDWAGKTESPKTELPPQPTIVKGNKSTPEIAPLPPESTPIFAPPIEDEETSNEDNNQETHLRVSGVCKMEIENPFAKPLPPPNLNNIQPEDLRRLDRLSVLYDQAVARQWFSPGEAMTLNFVAAAVRAREVGERPGPLFMTLVRRQLWQHITLVQEDHARRALARYRELRPEGFGRQPTAGGLKLAA